MLSKIQQGQAFQLSQNLMNPEEREELLLSNAFSTVAVIDNDVAVMSRGIPGPTLEVIASTTKNPIITPPSTGVLS